MKRIRSIAVFGVFTLVAFAATAFGASKPELSLPKVHTHARVIGSGKNRSLLIESMSIAHDPDVNVRISCGGCPRYRSPLPRVTKPSARVTRYLGLEWIIHAERHVQVLVTQLGAIGRYMILGVELPFRKRSLAAQSSGCLNGQRQRVACSTPEAEKQPAIPQGELFEETAGGETGTWADYTNASGEGPLIHSGQTVQVSCRVEGLPVEDGDPWWYRIATSPWNGSYYASADAFYNNGQTSGSLHGTPFYDPRVQVCK